MIRTEAAGYANVLNVHDEIVAEVPIDFGSVLEYEKLVTQLPTWAEGLPIAAKAWSGHRYRKD
jgi:DNA polymerase